MAWNALRYAICGVFTVATGLPQTHYGADPPPRFAVASAKRCARAFDDVAAGGRGRGARAVSIDPGRIRINCLPLENIIMQAYVLHANGQSRSMLVIPRAEEWVRGGPSWIGSAYYAIDAKPEGTQTSAMMLGPMLQRLLEKRFQLRVHHEAKETPAYALVGAKGGPKLEVTKREAARR